MVILSHICASLSRVMRNMGLSQIFGGRCLNQDLQDLQDLRIFRIAGDRSILVQRILFALV